MNETIPLFAVLGHPNEGKSSVVSTLAEDDSVRISPVPGETCECREFPVVIDGNTIIRFVDTPGFQNPRRTMEWIEAYTGPPERMIADFIRTHRDDESFSDECEIFSPLAEGAGIIFVVDGARPFRRIDAIEMEILRKTGLPRMIVINNKEKTEHAALETWKTEARKHFNTVRLFDAHQAGFTQRIELLESLKHIDPDWQPALKKTIAAFTADWHRRIEETAAIIEELLRDAARHKEEKTARNENDIDRLRETLVRDYKNRISTLEKQAHTRIRKRFKHNVFSWELPEHSVLQKELFDSRTWEVLGLTRRQMTIAGGGIGAGIGAPVDLALGGLTFGVFTALGSLIGAGSAAAGMKKMAGAKVKGLPLGGVRVRVGLPENDQLLYVLTDRCLVYFSHVIHRAHSRRDAPEAKHFEGIDIAGHLSAAWKEENRRIARDFFRALRKGDDISTGKASAVFREMLADLLSDISGVVRHGKG